MEKRDKNSARTGINIRRYCAEHEAVIRARLAQEDADEALLRLHRLKLAWLQHERLVHLIVMCLVAVLFLFSIGLFLWLKLPLVLLLVAVSLGLLAAYIRHYFFLENTVQSWYLLYGKLYDALKAAR